jgi:hypothetical protein
MPMDKIPKPVNGIVRRADLFPEPVKYLFCLMAEKLNQNIVFIFKIEIDGSISDPGFLGNQ